MMDYLSIEYFWDNRTLLMDVNTINEILTIIFAKLYIAYIHYVESSFLNIFFYIFSRIIIIIKHCKAFTIAAVYNYYKCTLYSQADYNNTTLFNCRI